MINQKQSMHGQWSSRWAFIFAASSAAVGLGNIWKFPYIAGENGGGAFVLIYLICIALIGLPLMIAEIMVGRRGRQNPANAFQTLAIEAKRSWAWKLSGMMMILAGALILSYYSVIAGWALDYVLQSCAGHFSQASASDIDTLFTQLIANPYKLLLFHSIIMSLTIAVVAFGVEQGLERAVKYMFPAMLVLLLMIAVYSANTDYFAHGLSFLFQPDFTKLSANGLLIAMGHAFFTLSLATGSIMMYGAYLPQRTSITKASVFIACADTFIALIAGLAIFPIVFAHGLTPSAGPGLIFKTLPLAFGHMPYGQVVAIAFFLMLVFAAFTSAISLLEPSVAWLVEQRGISRQRAAIIIGFILWILGLGTVFSFNIGESVRFFGLTFFDAIDYLTANILLPFGGLLTAIFVAWYLKKQTLLDELNFKSMLYYRLWHVCLAYITPIAVVVVFLNAIGIIHLNGH